MARKHRRTRRKLCPIGEIYIGCLCGLFLGFIGFVVLLNLVLVFVENIPLDLPGQFFKPAVDDLSDAQGPTLAVVPEMQMLYGGIGGLIGAMAGFACGFLIGRNAMHETLDDPTDEKQTLN